MAFYTGHNLPDLFKSADDHQLTSTPNPHQNGGYTNNHLSDTIRSHFLAIV